MVSTGGAVVVGVPGAGSAGLSAPMTCWRPSAGSQLRKSTTSTLGCSLLPRAPTRVIVHGPLPVTCTLPLPIVGSDSSAAWIVPAAGGVYLARNWSTKPNRLALVGDGAPRNDASEIGAVFAPLNWSDMAIGCGLMNVSVTVGGILSDWTVFTPGTSGTVLDAAHTEYWALYRPGSRGARKNAAPPPTAE